MFRKMSNLQRLPPQSCNDRDLNMHIITKIFIGLVALLHSYFLVFEMFFWESWGPDIFKSFPPELFPETTVLAANQGLYNGFLAAGLLWALFFIRDRKWQHNVAGFFLICVSIAGLYGAASTGSMRILLVQTLPAVTALLLFWVLDKKEGPA